MIDHTQVQDHRLSSIDLRIVAAVDALCVILLAGAVFFSAMAMPPIVGSQSPIGQADQRHSRAVGRI